MKILRQIGNATNTPTNEYMVETDEEREALKDTAPFGSYCIQFGKDPVTEEDEVRVYILNSSKQWILAD